MRKKRMPCVGWQYLALAAALIFLRGSMAVGGGGIGPRLKGDCSIEIIGEPKINEPFEVVYTFTPRQSLLHTKGIPDTAYIGSEKGVKLIGGDTLWTGFLEMNHTYSLHARFIVDTAIGFRFRAVIVAMQVTGIAKQPLHEGADLGVKARCGTTSGIMQFGTSTTQKGEWKNLTTDSAVKIRQFDMSDTQLARAYRDIIASARVYPPPVLQTDSDKILIDNWGALPESLAIPPSRSGAQLRIERSDIPQYMDELPYIVYKADCDITGPAVAKPGEEFEITWVFIPRGPLAKNRLVLDTARLTSEKGTEFIGGDTLWIGFLERDKSYTLRGTYRCDSNMIAYFRTDLIAMQAGPGPGMPTRLTEKGTRAEAGCAFNLDIKDTALVKPQIFQKSTDGSPKIMKIEDGSPLALARDANGNPLRVTIDGGASKETMKIAKTKTICDTNIVTIDRQFIRTGQALRLSRSSNNMIRFSDDLCKPEIIKDESFDVKQLDSSGLFFQIIIKNGIKSIEIRDCDSSYRVPVEYLSSYLIRGRATYSDNSYVLQPISDGLIEVYNCNDGNCSSVSYAGGTYTLSDGSFSIYSDHSLILIYLFSSNESATVLYPGDHDLSDGDPLYYYTAGYWLYNPYYYDYDFADTCFYFADLDESGAFGILATVDYCTQFIKTEIGYEALPDPNFIIWDNLDASSNTSYFGGYEIDNIPIIYVASRESRYSNWDEWDKSCILHEYGHYIMWHDMEPIPDASGEWSYYYTYDDQKNLNKSLSEGWADFFSGIVLGSPIFTNSTVQYPVWYQYNFELPKPDVPYYDWGEDWKTQPPHDTMQYEGALVVGAVVEALWDLYDTPNDGNYYSDGTLWGHNDDYNGSSYWRGIDYIWDVLANYDPQPDNADHNHCWNIYEFIEGWRKSGYPANSTFVNLLYAHGVYRFIPGDFDNNGIVNLLDILAYVEYKMKGGAKPYPMSRMDVNADCTLDLLDALYLINYKFKEGPEPLVGCVEE